MSITHTTCPISDERVQLFALLLDTNARLVRSMGAVLEESCDLPLSSFEVLMQLHSAPEGRLKMNEIADAIVLSTGGTTRLVDRLEEAGFVARKHCPEDRRAIHVSITDLGNAKLDEALQVHLTHLEAQLGQRLTCDERTSLTALLQKLQTPA